MADNDQIFEFDPSSILAALDRVNQRIQAVGKDGGKSADSLAKAWEDFSTKIIKVSDRSAQAQQRYVKSIEATAAAYGRSGVDKLIAQRDLIIKRLGDEEKLVKRVTEAYAKMIAAEQGRGAGSGSIFGGPNSPAALGLRAIRDIGQGRIGYGVSTGASALTGLGGATAVVGGLTVALGALSIASYKSMSSLAELGVQTQAASLKMGISAKQVGEFSFAAKAVGQEIDVFERGMRGLTQAVEDQTSAGDKARAWLTKFGVDISGLRAGTASTADTFRQIAAGVDSMASPLERNKALLDLFKRAGIEMVPVIENLEKNLAKAKEYGFGLGDEEEKKLLHYKDQLAVIDAQWERIWRHAKEHLADLASGAIDLVGKNQQTKFDSPYWIGKTFDRPGMPGAPGFTAAAREALAASRAQEASAAMSTYRAGSGLEGLLKEAESKRGKMGDEFTDFATMRKAQAQDRVVQGIKDEIKLQNQVLEVEQKIAKLGMDLAVRVGRPYGITKAETELEGVAKSPGVTQAQIERARAMLIPASRVELQQVLARAQDQGRAEIAREADKGLGLRQTKDVLVGQLSKDDMKDLEQTVRNAEATLKYQAGLDTRTAETGVRVRGLLGPQTPGARMQEEAQLAQVKRAAANEELRHAEAVMTAEEVGEGKLQEVRIKHAEELGRIQDEMLVKQAEEVRRQIDEIKKPAEQLFTTLLTHPSKFGKELGTTLHQAAIRPIVNAASESTARFLQPLIFGGTNSGGLASIRPINGAMPVVIMGGGGTTGSSGGSTSVYGGGAIAAAMRGGGTVPMWGGPMGGLNIPMLGPGGTSGFAGPVGGLGGSESAGTYAGPGSGGGAYGGTSAHAGGAFNGAFGGLSKASLAGLGASFGIGGALIKGAGNTVHFGGTSIGSVLSSKGAGGLELAGGTALATAGLGGQRRGTGLGVLEAGVGGAGIGAGIGTMFLPGVGTAIGAGIGAAAGTLAGLGEMLAGVRSPREKAKEQVKSIYHINISNNMADQIVSLAQSKYGGNISVTTRSPEVRQMLGVYAAGTGQSKSFPMGADTPHGGGLVESGGRLFQSTQYQYGNPYAYSSSLPTYGNGPAGYLPSPGAGGSSAMTFHIDGGSISNFMNGQVITPDAVSSKYGDAMAWSSGRLQSSSDITDPGSLVS